MCDGRMNYPVNVIGTSLSSISRDTRANATIRTNLLGKNTDRIFELFIDTVQCFGEKIFASGASFWNGLIVTAREIE